MMTTATWDTHQALLIPLLGDLMKASFHWLFYFPISLFPGRVCLLELHVCPTDASGQTIQKYPFL